MLIFRYLSHVTVRRVSVLLQPKNVGFIITRGCYSCRSDNDKASVKERFKLPKRYGIAETSVWIEYAAVVAELKPKVNLGQGFADFLPPKSALDALTKAVATPNYLLHQYTRGFGYPRLVQNLSKLYSPVFGKEINPMTEILVGAGAYESLYCAILGHVDDGEEVIIIEPYYDCYSEMVKGANGVCRFIPLRLDACEGETVSSADWVLDEEELTSLFNDNTKMIVVNTPHNPIGKVYKKRELELIADLCQKYNVLCLADEVYEFVVYEPNKHVKMATLPGMWERTITVGSAGKVFSATGWRTGWACGPAYLLENMQIVHQNCVFTCNTFVQEALAQALEVELSRRDTPECYMNSIPEELLPKRELMKNALVDNGFTPTEPEGGFFMIADWSKLADKMDLSTLPDKYEDYKFTKMLAKEAGVLALPASAFYGKEHKKLGEKFARFCFIKRDENLKLAADLMKQWNDCS